MDVGVYPYPQGDPLLIDKIVNEFLAQGRFDRLRKECMSDADTKPAYQNLQQRVDNTVTQFLKKQVWRPDLNKNQLRDSLRKHILESGFFDAGINRIVDQVVNPNVLTTVFLPEVEEVVYNYLSIPKPSDKNFKKGLEEEKAKQGKENESKVLNDSKALNDSSSTEKNDKEKGNQEKINENQKSEDQKTKDFFEKKSFKENEIPKECIKTEQPDSKESTESKIKSEPEEKNISTTPPPIAVTSQVTVEKVEVPSEESQESLNRTEGLQSYDSQWTPVPDSDDSVPLEINEKSVSDSRDSEDSIMNQMSPISQGRLTPDLELESREEKPDVKVKEEKDKFVEKEEKKPLTFIGRIPKIKREDSEPKKEDAPKEKLDVKNIYSSDESDSNKSYGRSDSDEKRKKMDKPLEEQKRDSSDKKRDHSSSSRDRKKDKSNKHKDKRDKSRDREKKSSSSSSSSQREKSSSHSKSSHRHKDSKTKRKEDEKKKSKSTDDHGKERSKKEDRRSTDRDGNEREKDKSSNSRSQGESRKREKEQPKEEGKKKGDKKEDAQVEKEVEGEAGDAKVVTETKVPENAKQPVMKCSVEVLDFKKLIRGGALTRFEFPKLSDDFYVKFNSTGFKYFEDWEKSKLDCEEEFKEFVDEAENNLSLLSDDEMDFEFENDLVEENRKTIENLQKGLGNFSQSLMFDPGSSEFYEWTNNKYYEKFRKKGQAGKNESEGTVKKIIDRDKNKENRERENMALHLKLLNRYKRKAMRLGKPRRRHRRPGFGIKEKNDNRSSTVNRFEFGKTENYLELPGLVGSEHPVPENINSLNLFENKRVTLPDSPEENEDWGESQKLKRTATSDSKTSLPQTISINLPLSPDSDDANTNNDLKGDTRKRIHKEREDEGAQKKQRRSYSQKYDSQDLYKPRLILNSSRTRGRERGLEQDVVSIGSGDSKSSTK